MESSNGLLVKEVERPGDLKCNLYLVFKLELRGSQNFEESAILGDFRDQAEIIVGLETAHIGQETWMIQVA